MSISEDYTIFGMLDSLFFYLLANRIASIHFIFHVYEMHTLNTGTAYIRRFDSKCREVLLS